MNQACFNRKVQRAQSKTTLRPLRALRLKFC